MRHRLTLSGLIITNVWSLAASQYVNNVSSFCVITVRVNCVWKAEVARIDNLTTTINSWTKWKIQQRWIVPQEPPPQTGPRSVQPCIAAWQTDWQTPGIIDRSSPHLIHSMRFKNSGTNFQHLSGIFRVRAVFGGFVSTSARQFYRGAHGRTRRIIGRTSWRSSIMTSC